VIGFAVIGLGGIGLLHAHTLTQQLVGARLVMVVDPLADLATATADELGVRWSRCYDDALADPEVCAVVIATPSSTHAEMVARAAACGTHVFCEKPLSLDLPSGRHATNIARERGVCLQIGFQRRFDRDFVAAKKCIAGGEIGTVRMLRISHRNRVPPPAEGLTARLGSVYVDMTIHDFDSARWLVGDIADLQAYATPHTALVVLRFEDGALGVIDNTRCAGYGFECSVEVVGSESTIRVRGESSSNAVEHLTSQGRHQALPADHIERHCAAYRDELRHFLACIGSGTQPLVGGEDAVEALRLSLLAERCAA
jgi:predicted dehydrogenase